MFTEWEGSWLVADGNGSGTIVFDIAQITNVNSIIVEEVTASCSCLATENKITIWKNELHGDQSYSDFKFTYYSQLSL